MTHNKPSIVQYFSKQQNVCGYCLTPGGFHSYELNACILKVEDYQEMIDRGWRRCGKHCYKPNLGSSCCLLYTIRCAALEFKLSKTQKKILKRFNNFLINGTVTKDKVYKTTDIMQPMEISNFLKDEKNPLNKNLSEEISHVDPSVDVMKNCLETVHAEGETNKPIEAVSAALPSSQGEIVKKRCKKAKQLRIEKKRQKLQKLGLSEEEINKKMVEKKKYPVVKSLEDYLKEPLSKKTCHNLKISLVRTCPRSEEYIKTSTVAFELYKRYQMFIHKSSPECLTQKQFERFLVISPLQAENGYGSYHQQYWLDDKLIAVGVIDILPKCVSSVYFFYDPDYSFLSLGTYGALREIEFTRMLSSRFVGLEYYYMGYYIHSCVKMKYKGSFKPSYLLCPEIFSWHLIQDCLPKIEASRCIRFNTDPNAFDVNSVASVSEILILYDATVMTLASYLKKKNCSQNEYYEIMEYAKVVGKTCGKRMLLARCED